MKNKLPELILIVIFLLVFFLGLWAFLEVQTNGAKMLVFLSFAFIELIVIMKYGKVIQNK